MSERKVINKYYPPDYDPSKVPRVRRKTKQNDVRIMAPFNLRCSTCGNYIANATKFNAKKETVEDQTYNNLMIFRFYIKCPRCMATIIFRTNLKDKGYEIEHGATENFMALKMAEKRAQEEAEADEEEEKINPMKHLENRTKASKQQMEASEHLQNLRSIKYQINKINMDSFFASRSQEGKDKSESCSTPNQEDAIRQEARRILKRKEIESATLPSTSRVKNPQSRMSTSESRIASSLANLKKKIKVVVKEP